MDDGRGEETGRYGSTRWISLFRAPVLIQKHMLCYKCLRAGTFLPRFVLVLLSTLNVHTNVLHYSGI